MSQIMCTHVHAHTHTVPRREGWTIDNKKAPKGQKHNLKGSSLSFCKERKSRKKRAERLVDSVLEQGTQRKHQLNLKANGGDSEVL